MPAQERLYDVGYFRTSDPDYVVKCYHDRVTGAIQSEVMGDRREEKRFEFTYTQKMPLRTMTSICKALNESEKGIKLYEPYEFFPAFEGHVPEGITPFEGTHRMG